MKHKKSSLTKKHGRNFFAALTALATLLIPHGANAVGKWQKLPDGQVIQDYYAPVNRNFLDLVNLYHMRAKEKLHDKSVYTYNAGDILYTLTHLPNHPLALRRATITCTEHPDLLSCGQVDEYFDKAVKWDPKQPNTQALYGVFLQMQGKDDEALEHYALALAYKPSLADAHYNMGLIYYKQENWEAAVKHAQAAYAAGHRAPSLRRKLRDKGLLQ